MTLGKACPFTLPGPSAKAAPAQPSPVPGAATALVCLLYYPSCDRRVHVQHSGAPYVHTHTPHFLTHTRGTSILDCAVL